MIALQFKNLFAFGEWKKLPNVSTQHVIAKLFRRITSVSTLFVWELVSKQCKPPAPAKDVPIGRKGNAVDLQSKESLDYAMV